MQSTSRNITTINTRSPRTIWRNTETMNRKNKLEMILDYLRESNTQEEAVKWSGILCVILHKCQETKATFVRCYGGDELNIPVVPTIVATLSMYYKSKDLACHTASILSMITHHDVPNGTEDVVNGGGIPVLLTAAKEHDYHPSVLQPVMLTYYEISKTCPKAVATDRCISMFMARMKTIMLDYNDNEAENNNNIHDELGIGCAYFLNVVCNVDTVRTTLPKKFGIVSICCHIIDTVGSSSDDNSNCIVVSRLAELVLRRILV